MHNNFRCSESRLLLSLLFKDLEKLMSRSSIVKMRPRDAH